MKPYMISITRNQLTGRFHPFLWAWKPYPHEDSTCSVTRFKSKGHHTEGFATFEEAQAQAERWVPQVERRLGPCMTVLSQAEEDAWGPAELPARVLMVPLPATAAGPPAEA